MKYGHRLNVIDALLHTINKMYPTLLAMPSSMKLGPRGQNIWEMLGGSFSIVKLLWQVATVERCTHYGGKKNPLLAEHVTFVIFNK